MTNNNSYNHSLRLHTDTCSQIHFQLISDDGSSSSNSIHWSLNLSMCFTMILQTLAIFSKLLFLSMLLFLAQSIKNYAPALIVLISISDKKKIYGHNKTNFITGFFICTTSSSWFGTCNTKLRQGPTTYIGQHKTECSNEIANFNSSIFQMPDPQLWFLSTCMK